MKHQLHSSSPCPPLLPPLLSPASSSPSVGVRMTLKPSTPWVSTYRPYLSPPPPRIPIPIPTISSPYRTSFPLSATPSRTGHRGLKASSSRASQTSFRPHPCWKKCHPAHVRPGFTSLRPRASIWYANPGHFFHSWCTAGSLLRNRPPALSPLWHAHPQSPQNIRLNSRIFGVSSRQTSEQPNFRG